MRFLLADLLSRSPSNGALVSETAAFCGRTSRVGGDCTTDLHHTRRTEGGRVAFGRDHLFRRVSVYWWRRRAPEPLELSLQRTEISRSLTTREPALARRRARMFGCIRLCHPVLTVARRAPPGPRPLQLLPARNRTPPARQAAPTKSLRLRASARPFAPSLRTAPSASTSSAGLRGAVAHALQHRPAALLLNYCPPVPDVVLVRVPDHSLTVRLDHSMGLVRLGVRIRDLDGADAPKTIRAIPLL